VTVLSAAQSAGIRLLARRPASLFSNDDSFGLELGELATEAATDIAEYYDWQKLKVLQTHAGDGLTVAFDLAADYGRMLKDGEVHSLNWRGRSFRKVDDENEWIYLQQTTPLGAPGAWIILSGQLQIFPPMPTGEQASYYYISNNIIADSAALLAGGSGNILIDEDGNHLSDEHADELSDGVPFLSKPAFTDDNDVFVLPERLLTLSLIWRWRAQKRMEYAEDLTNYETALATAAGTDKGARILVVGRQRNRIDAGQPVFPGRINV
jgi:hypothetical protein